MQVDAKVEADISVKGASVNDIISSVRAKFPQYQFPDLESMPKYTTTFWQQLEWLVSF